MVWGYSKRTVDAESGLLEMSEVSFDFSPADLRHIAEFLASAADRIESGLRTDHLHIDEVISGWDPDLAGSDIIVINPSPEPPKLVV